MPTVNLARERSMYHAFSDNALKARQSEMARLQEQLGTGRRINRASDDAAGYAGARQMEVLAERYEQYARSIASARSWTDHTQDALDRLADLFTQAQEEGVRFANGTFSDDDREAAAKHLESVLTSMTDQLNSKAGGEYLFAGSRTTVAPFSLTGTTVAYAGNDGGRERHIGRDLSLNINIPGTELIDTGEGYTIMEAMSGLIDAVRAGDPADMEAALERIGVARDHVIDVSGEAGSIAERLTLAETQLADASLLVEGRRSDYEDADYAETLLHFQQAQTGLQAALRVASSVLQTTLLDYLR